MLRVGLIALILGLALPATAKDKRRVDKLAVLPIIIPGPHGQASLSSVIDDVSAASGLRVGLRLISQEEIFVQGSGDLGSKVRECGSDTACIANKLRAFDARLGLVVVANLVIDPPLISLQLMDTDERRMVGQSIGELDVAADKTVSGAVRRRAAEIFETAGYLRAGRLLVQAEPPSATIAVAGGFEPNVGTPNVFTLPPGKYEVRADKDGYERASGVADVVGGSQATLRLSLAEKTSVVKSWWFWTIIGVAVAGGTTAAVVATRPTTRCLCVTINGIGCEVCE